MTITEKDMTFKGLARRIDPLGRIVIPSEYRKVLGIEEYDNLEMFLTQEGGVYLKKVEKEDKA